MDPVEKVITLFHLSIAARAEQGEALAEQLVHASNIVSNTFVNEGKVLLCGYGGSSIMAHHFATLLLNQNERERPALPAIILDPCVAMLSAIGQSYGASEIFSRQIRALGQSGDVLIIYTTTGNPQSLINAVQAAHERGMSVICLGGNEGGNLSQLLHNEDLAIQASANSDALLHEMHLLMTFILCELIDDQLFGGINP